ncbi:MAG TPA: hypothetical protein VGJ20_17000 [Xanthobacteraceae bacterium]
MGRPTSEVHQSKRERLEAALESLEALGLIRRNGEFRRGEPVYVVTELGKRIYRQGDFRVASDTKH